MKTIQGKSIFNWLLAVSVIATFLVSLAMRYGAGQAATPVGPSYIMVFKDTVSPRAEVPDFAKAYATTSRTSRPAHCGF